MSWACSAWGVLEACRAGSLDAAALQQARAEGAAAQGAAQRVVEALLPALVRDARSDDCGRATALPADLLRLPAPERRLALRLLFGRPA